MARVTLLTLRAALVTVALSIASPVRAQSESELRTARELFQDAYRDEQDRRYPEALEKFQRVARVKETDAVRYRIASVLAEMGRLREARDLFRALAHASGPTDTAITDSAAEEAAQLGRRIPKLALAVLGAPARARVTIDGAPVPVAARSTFELDPGAHVVAASVGARIVHETTLSLAEGDVVKHVISFDQRGPDVTLGVVSIGAGTALVVTTAVLLALRESAIGSVEDTCPRNVCPASSRSAVESDRDRANLYRPLALGLGLGGLVAAGVGVYLLATRSGRGSAPMTSRSDPASTRSRFVLGSDLGSCSDGGPPRARYHHCVRLAACFAWTLLGCSSVPDVTFADGGAQPAPDLDATTGTLTRVDASKPEDAGPSKPVDAGPVAYRCPDRPPPGTVGICCGTRLCLKCSYVQCDRCAKESCDEPSVCCAKNPGTSGNSIACQSAPTCG